MKDHGIISAREKLDEVISKYNDFLGNEAVKLCREYGIEPVKKLQADLTSIAEENRLLKIGIVGRVKAGKSSLLNALLFQGQSLLPKAATPMTAALTTLSHGETLAAEVEFFSDEDFANIEAKNREYETEWERLYETYLGEVKHRTSRPSTASRTPEERAQSKADREMREKTEISAAHDQYTRMKKAGWANRNSGKETLKFASLTDLRGQLDDYVGAKGRYMPFTKSVNIRLPQENLKDIEIVDTPGINDPVQSREERTREHLSQCDVVLIVSPTGQFMTTEDLNLMDRITSKEGVRELRVVAAQADTQLYGSLKADNDGQLDRVLDRLSEILGNQLKKVIADLKESNPEVGNSYDSLLAGKGSVIVSSGMCESLKQRFGSQDEWDEDMRHAWDNLLAMYPDYFSAMDANLSDINLDKLSSIGAVRDVVEGVRVKKDEIIQERTRDYIQAKIQALQSLKDGLLVFVNTRQHQIERVEIEQFRQLREDLTKSLHNAAKDIQEAYEDWITRIENDLKNELQRELRSREQDLEEEIDQAKGITTESYEEGLIFKKTLQKTHETLRTNAVYHVLSRFAEDLAEEVAEKTEDKIRDYRKELVSEMTKVLRENFSSERLESRMIRHAVRDIIQAIDIPAFDYKKPIPSYLRPRGVLKGSEADDFFSNACDYVKELCREIKGEISKYRKSLAKSMAQIRLDDRLLQQFTKELDDLEKPIEDKKIVLNRIRRLKDELERIEVNYESAR